MSVFFNDILAPLRSPSAMKISVIMPAFNEEKHIEKTLRALSAQTLPIDAFEVVLVDNGSTDGTMDIARQFFSTLSLRIVTKTGGTIGSVRNHGARLANGEVLVFLDSDCVPPSTWLSDALGVKQDKAIWGAHYGVPEDGTWISKLWGRYQAIQQKGDVSFIPTASLFIAAADFESIGEFNERLETSEDVELSQRARAYGLRVMAFPQLAVAHYGAPATLQQFYRQNRWHGKHVLRVFIDNLPKMNGLPVIALGVYTLILFWICIPLFLLGEIYHHLVLAWIPLLLLVLPATFLSLWKTLRVGQVNDFPQLWVLYMTYFLARAASLTHRSGRNHR